MLSYCVGFSKGERNNQYFWYFAEFVRKENMMALNVFSLIHSSLFGLHNSFKLGAENVSHESVEVF